jgi:hypothetical protein
MSRHAPMCRSRRGFCPRVEEFEPRLAPAAGFEVTPTTGLVTTEAGATATFTVRLTELPTDDVVIQLSSSSDAEGTPDLTSLTFTAANWDVAQTVTITGADDFIDDGDVPYQIVLDAAVSNDVNYSGLDPANVDVVNQDDDAGGLVVTPQTSLSINEGGVALINVQLASQPTDTVTIPVAALGKFRTEAVVKPAQLVFTPDNWNVPQRISVRGKPDKVLNELKEVVKVRIGAAVSSDAVYAGAISNFDVAIRDLGLRAFRGTFTGSFLTNPFTPISGVGVVSGPLHVKVAGVSVTISTPPGGTGSVKFVNSSRAAITFTITVKGVKIDGKGIIKVLGNGVVVANGTWRGGDGGGVWELARV